MYFSIKAISITSSAEYSTTKPDRVTSTSVTLRLETAADVGNMPSMIQAWRPYSATNQPISEAIQGSGIDQTAMCNSHRRFWRTCSSFRAEV